MNPESLPERIIIARQHVPPAAGEDEQDVLAETIQIREAICALGVKTKVVEVRYDFERALTEIRDFHPALVFNLLETLEGHGRLQHLFPAMLEAERIPFTGCSSEALNLSNNKPLAKTMMKNEGISTPGWALCPLMDKAAPYFEPAYIVKHRFEHASVGLFETSVCHTRAELDALVSRIPAEQSPAFFIEQFIDGREFNLSVLDGADGPQVLPPAEIRFDDFAPGKPQIVDYKAKWDKSSFQYYHTDRSFDFAEKDNGLLEQLTVLALKCWKLFGLRGYARVDFRIDVLGKPYVLEVNTNPCISRDGGFAAAVEKSGLTYEAAVKRIIESALICYQ